jgi:uncharacterized protein (TIGR04255 family)
VEQRAFESSIEIGPSGVARHDAKQSGVVGYQFISLDRKQIAQFRVDGFTFNRLAPYTSWVELSPVVQELWQQYKETARPQMIVRLALRFINHVAFPEQLEDFSQVMTAPPPVPSEFPQEVSRFLTRVTVHDSAKQLAAHVAQAFNGAGTPPAKFILDIDAVREGDLEVDSPDVDAILDALHDFKNRLFFASLTPSTVERYI